MVHQNNFMDKWGSALKYWGNWGFAGLICGYLFMFELPALRKDAKEREQQMYDRSDKARETAITHGDRAVDRISDSLERQSQMIDSRQQQGHTLQKETVEALQDLKKVFQETRLRADKSE